MAAIEAAHVLVSGIVQGVGYRAWTERTARELRLSGWVRNLDDGRVEIFAEGDGRVLDYFIERCEVGPRHAQVENVASKKIAVSGATIFEVKRTATEPISF